MKENTTISRNENSSLLTSAPEDEIIVAQILLDLPSMIGMLESGSGFKWGLKKRRSSLDEGASSPRAPSSMSFSFQKIDVVIEEREPQAKTKLEVATTASPVTPLAFSPSESDERSRHALKSCSRKRSREKYIDMIEALSQRRDLLREEIENLTNYYNKLIAYNSELKAMKQEVLNSCPRKEDPKVEISRDRNLGVELSQHHQISLEPQRHPQPLAADLMAEKFQHSIGPITTQFHSSYNGLGSVGPFGIPDLNISAEEAFGVDQSQPLDTSRAFTDRRARFAEARRRRMDIIKIKSMRSACGIKFPR